MTLHFSIEYHTEWGQNVEVELTFLSSDGKTHRQHIPLETEDGLLWKGVFMLKARGKQLRYTYIITASSDGGGVGGATVIRREWDVVPRLFPADDARTYFFIDHWRDVPEASFPAISVGQRIRILSADAAQHFTLKILPDGLDFAIFHNFSVFSSLTNLA